MQALSPYATPALTCCLLVQIDYYDHVKLMTDLKTHHDKQQTRSITVLITTPE